MRRAATLAAIATLMFGCEPGSIYDTTHPLALGSPSNVIVDPCAPSPCLQPGRTICSYDAGVIRCLCDPGYELNVDGFCVIPNYTTVTVCEPNPCTEIYRSVCSGVDGVAICSCDSGYVANDQGSCLDPCATVDCGANGTCAVMMSSAICQCDPGYGVGADGCESLVDPTACTPNPCTQEDRTVCTDFSGVAQCSCNPGFDDDGFGGCTEADPSAGGALPFTDMSDTTTTDISMIATLHLTGGQVIASTSVLTQNGDPLAQLTEGNFSVVEVILKGLPVGAPIVDVVSQGNGDTLEVSVVLVIDSSGSMGPDGPGSAMELAKEAAKLFVDNKEATDQIMVIDFDDVLVIRQGFTTDASLLRAAIDAVDLGGGTHVWDAIDTAVDAVKVQTGSRIVVAMTDGQDAGSAVTVDQVAAKAKSEGVPIFTIGLGGVTAVPLEQLANETGGIYQYAANSSDLAAVYQKASQHVRNRYLIRWYSTGSSGDDVTAYISVSYTAANGTFTEITVQTYRVP